MITERKAKPTGRLEYGSSRAGDSGDSVPRIDPIPRRSRVGDTR